MEAEELFLRAKTLAPSDYTVYQHYGKRINRPSKKKKLKKL